MTEPRNVSSRLLAAFLIFLICSCANLRSEQVQTIAERSILPSAERNKQPPVTGGDAFKTGAANEPVAGEPAVRFSHVPVIAGAPAGVDDGPGSAPPEISVETVDAFVPPLELPAFIDVVFGQMLSVPYITGQGVAARTDVVQLRSSGALPSQTFLELVTTALADYGVRVTAEDGVFKILEDQALKARMPQFIRSRARRDTPSALRPVVQFVELNAISANNMSGLLRQAFGERQTELKIDANPANNFIVLSGLPDDVDAAIAIIEQMDELQYAGTRIVRYEPIFWDAEALSRELSTLLTAEGWQASTTIAAPRTILIVPIIYSNALFIFTRSSEARLRTLHWLNELDRPAKTGDVPQIFVYNVQNVDAELLAGTVNAVLSGGRLSAGAGPLSADGGSSSGNAGAGLIASGGQNSIVVDPMGNRLIFTGAASDYERLLALMRQLDQAPAEVLIEVTVAEVTLSDQTRFGVEWVIDNLGGRDIAASIAQQGLGLGSGGLDFGILTGDVRLDFNAFAQNTQVKVLSTPRLVARSGGAARIQVGADVPIISSQRAAAAQDGVGGTDILQSVEYRSTGVLLSIEPIVFGDNRIDLNISQEVSTALPTTSAEISSPTISNRSITTVLSLEDGATAVIGGLIQDNVTNTKTGIPLLKDIPIIGAAFSNRDITVDRTELVILITAYVIRNQDDKSAFVREFTREIDEALTNSGDLKTLMPANY